MTFIEKGNEQQSRVQRAVPEHVAHRPAHNRASWRWLIPGAIAGSLTIVVLCVFGWTKVLDLLSSWGI